MNRRTFLASIPALAAARSLLGAAGAPQARIGICTFSCHQQWNAVQAKQEGVKFSDAIGFYGYGRSLGAEGVQTALRSKDETIAKQLRKRVEEDSGYYEGDLSLPKNEADIARFETDVKLVRETGAVVARSTCTGARRYEFFKTLDEFLQFHAQSEKSLALAEPIVRKYRLKLAIENHKDHTADELVALMKKYDSEWLGVLVDTGNNIGLLEDPYETVEALAPYAMSVHFKDMAVQPYEDGFLLSEVLLGTGALDLPRIVASLTKSNPSIVFNLEMATRDPLRVPCLTDRYFATFPERKAGRLEAMMAWVKTNPPRQQPPFVSGKSVVQILADEEANNRDCLGWMRKNLREPGKDDR